MSCLSAVFPCLGSTARSNKWQWYRGLSLQERYWGAGVCPKKGNGAGERMRREVWWGGAEGAGVV